MMRWWAERPPFECARPSGCASGCLGLRGISWGQREDGGERRIDRQIHALGEPHGANGPMAFLLLGLLGLLLLLLPGLQQHCRAIPSRSGQRTTHDGSNKGCGATLFFLLLLVISRWRRRRRPTNNTNTTTSELARPSIKPKRKTQRETISASFVCLF